MDRLEELLERWEELREAGTPISVEELCVDDPHCVELLRAQISELEAFEEKFGRLQTFPSQSPECNSSVVKSLKQGDLITVLNSFEVCELHAHGGLGAIYRARESSLGRTVALKVPKQANLTEEQRIRFEREARITGMLEYPGVVPVYAMKMNSKSEPIYAMRFVAGKTLRELATELHTDGLIQEQSDWIRLAVSRRLVQAIATICSIVSYAHEKRVIHRDIKPSNILLGDYGEVLLLDWGLAKVIGESDQATSNSKAESKSEELTSDGSFLGTPAFASPEQFALRNSLVDEASDIFSLGATLYFVIFGVLPNANGADVTDTRMIERRRRLTPPALVAICERAMKVAKRDRYANADELRNELEAFLAGEPVAAYPEVISTRIFRFLKRRRGLTWGVLAFTSAVLLASIVSSYLLSIKNEELESSNDRIQFSMNETRAANAQALTALRSLLSDAVTEALSEKEIFSNKEKAYIESILAQYTKLANLPSNSEASRDLIAEGNLQAATILAHLSREEDALPRFETAFAIYEENYERERRTENYLGLTSTIEKYADTLMRVGNSKRAEEIIAKGLRLQETPLATVNEDVQRHALTYTGNLYRMQAELLLQQGKQAEGEKALRSGVELLERNSIELQNDLGVRSSLAGLYRQLSSGDFSLDAKEEEKFGEQAIKLYSGLFSETLDQRKYATALAWARYDSTFHLQREKKWNEAVRRLTGSINELEQMRSRYPLLVEYQGILATIIDRRSVMHQRNGSLELAEMDSAQAVSLFEQYMQEVKGESPGRLQYLRALAQQMRVAVELKKSSQAREVASKIENAARLLDSERKKKKAIDLELAELENEVQAILTVGQ